MTFVDDKSVLGAKLLHGPGHDLQRGGLHPAAVLAHQVDRWLLGDQGVCRSAVAQVGVPEDTELLE